MMLVKQEGAESSRAQPLIEGEDYYLEGSLFVFTAHYLLKRGYCCESGCRHCPYSQTDEQTESVPGREDSSQ
jgi:hypothetical protein